MYAGIFIYDFRDNLIFYNAYCVKRTHTELMYAHYYNVLYVIGEYSRVCFT